MLNIEPPQEHLAAGEVHVWTARVAAVEEAGLRDACIAMESDDERRRRLDSPSVSLGHLQLVSTALVRTTLSRYGELSPAAWCFRRNENGRPEIVESQSAGGLRFNLSHTGGLAACAVTRGADVGVDVESIARRAEVRAIADRFFTTDEARELRALDEARCRERFFELWTLKEAYVKARGGQLASGLRIRFRIDEDSPDAVLAESLDDATSWRFRLFRPEVGYVLAVAVRRMGGAEPTIRLLA